MLTEQREVTIYQNDNKLSADLLFGAITEEYIDPFLRVKLPTGQEYRADGTSYFDALNQLRIKLEADNILLGIQGCRTDFYWSNMSIQMSNGMVGYLLEMGKPATIKTRTFDKCEDLTLLTTVEHQKTCYKNWLNSLG